MEADFLATGNSEYTDFACPCLLFVYFHKNKTKKEPPDHVEATLTPGVSPWNPWAQLSIFLVVPFGGAFSTRSLPGRSSPGGPPRKSETQYPFHLGVPRQTPAALLQSPQVAASF